MSACDSNLSGPDWGYDIVCAVTQDGINGTMLDLLSTTNQQTTACYTQDNNNQPVLIQLADLIAQTGVDPFSIPDGTDETDPRVQKLNNANFWYAFKATLGIPAGLDPTKVPDVIVLNKGNSQLTYQMFWAGFSLVTMNYGAHNRCNISNIAQPANAPWLFAFTIDMNFGAAQQTPLSGLPPAAQAKLQNLDPGTMFSVQQLLIDVTTRGMQGVPTIESANGSQLDPSSPAFIALTQDFINTYWDHVAPGNSIVMGYNVMPAATAASSSLAPTALNFEIDAFSDPSQPGLNTLNYLVMTNNASMPPSVPFTWNWVDAADAQNFQGVMAVRRNIFSTFLSDLIQPFSSALSINTTISMGHDGEDFWTTLSAPSSGNPAQWAQTSPGTAAGADGYTKLLTISYSNLSSDNARDAMHISTIDGKFNYNLAGDISVSGNVIRLSLSTTAYCEFNAHIADIPAANLEANVVSLSCVASYTMACTPQGEMLVTVTPANPQPQDSSESINESKWDSLIGLGSISDLIDSVHQNLTDAISNALSNICLQVAAMLNGTSGWFYPGGGTFFFKDITFSNNQDLCSRLTYVSASAMEVIPEIGVAPMVTAQATTQNRMAAEVAK